MHPRGEQLPLLSIPADRELIAPWRDDDDRHISFTQACRAASFVTDTQTRTELEIFSRFAKDFISRNWPDIGPAQPSSMILTDSTATLSPVASLHTMSGSGGLRFTIDARTTFSAHTPVCAAPV